MEALSQAGERFARGSRFLEDHGVSTVGVVEANGDLAQYIVEFVFGDVYSRPGLSVRDREIATLSMLMAMRAGDAQIDAHLRLAAAAGVTDDEVLELVIQTSVYGGFPAAINAGKRLQAFQAER